MAVAKQGAFPSVVASSLNGSAGAKLKLRNFAMAALLLDS